MKTHGLGFTPHGESISTLLFFIHCFKNAFIELIGVTLLREVVSIPRGQPTTTRRLCVSNTGVPRAPGTLGGDPRIWGAGALAWGSRTCLTPLRAVLPGQGHRPDMWPAATPAPQCGGLVVAESRPPTCERMSPGGEIRAQHVPIPGFPTDQGHLCGCRLTGGAGELSRGGWRRPLGALHGVPGAAQPFQP